MVVTLRAEVGSWEAGKWQEGGERVDHKQAATEGRKSGGGVASQLGPTISGFDSEVSEESLLEGKVVVAKRTWWP